MFSDTKSGQPRTPAANNSLCYRGSPPTQDATSQQIFSDGEVFHLSVWTDRARAAAGSNLQNGALKIFTYMCTPWGKKKNCSAMTWQWHTTGLPRRNSSAVHITGSLAGHSQTWLRAVRLGSCQGSRSYASAKGLSFCTLNGNTEGICI